jgi:hypothetical protein
MVFQRSKLTGASATMPRLSELDDEHHSAPAHVSVRDASQEDEEAPLADEVLESRGRD